MIEHPAHAGGHLGAAKREDIADSRFDFARVLEETFELFKSLGLERERIPLVVAGGINSFEKVRHYLGLGAAGVQVGTAFAVTREGDAHINFKNVLAGAKQQDAVDHERGRPAGPRRTHPVPQELPQARGKAPGQCQG